MFIDRIEEKSNCFVEALEKCRNTGFKTFLYGAGGGADAVEARFPNYAFAGRIVDDNFFVEKPNVYSLSGFFSNLDTKVNIVSTFRNGNISSFEPFKDKISYFLYFDCFVGNYLVDSSIMTYEYISKHANDLERVANNLSDEFSREVLSAYINQKISMKYGFLDKVKTSPQYFEDFLKFDSYETFVDCGAFVGDSAISFVNTLKKRGINKYSKIISFEPDPINFEKMVKLDLKNHVCINKGTSDKEGKLCFSVKGSSSGLTTDGDILVEVNSLDEMVNERVTYIKMDIEGEELKSLYGAEKLIKKYRPKLAICIYHKKEDLWEIMDYISNLGLDYSFFIRAYESDVIELVLYAIPN